MKHSTSPWHAPHGGQAPRSPWTVIMQRPQPPLSLPPTSTRAARSCRHSRPPGRRVCSLLPVCRCQLLTTVRAPRAGLPHILRVPPQRKWTWKLLPVAPLPGPQSLGVLWEAPLLRGRSPGPHSPAIPLEGLHHQARPLQGGLSPRQTQLDLGVKVPIQTVAGWWVVGVDTEHSEGLSWDGLHRASGHAGRWGPGP